MKSCAPSVIVQYCDDILLASTEKGQHLSVLTRLLRALQEAGFLLNKRKAQLFLREVTFLGQSIGREGKRPLPDRVLAITKLTKPTTVTGLRSLMGLFNFNRVYIADFSDLAKPLSEALKGGLPGASP